MQSRERNFSVVERNCTPVEDLLLLVAFAGNQNHIAGLCGFEREMDGSGAIGLDRILDASDFKAGFDFGEDGERIFAAGIVAGGDDEVAALACGFAHLGALGAVAIAAAAEDSDDALARLRRHLARKCGQIAQRVVGVRVVDDHGEGLAGIDRLKAAGNRLERGNCGDKIAECDAARVCRCEGGEQIEDVDFAGEMRSDLRAACGCFKLREPRRRA